MDDPEPKEVIEISKDGKYVFVLDEGASVAEHHGWKLNNG